MQGINDFELSNLREEIAATIFLASILVKSMA